MKTTSLIVVIMILSLFILSSCEKKDVNPPAGLLIKADGDDMLTQIDKPLGSVSPLMSRVPSFPIELSFSNATISVTVEKVLFYFGV